MSEMNTIRIEHRHALTPAEAHERLGLLLRNLNDKYGVATEWLSTSNAKFLRTGLHGSLTIRSHSVSIEMTLAFQLKPLKGTIERQVKIWLEQCLACRHEAEDVAGGKVKNGNSTH